MSQPPPTAAEIAAWVADARRRTLELTDDLDYGRYRGERLDVVNPILWEIGHLVWFQEKWSLRHPHDDGSVLPHADALYDSASVKHGSRWDLPLPSREETLRYAAEVHRRVLDRLAGEVDPDERYFAMLGVFHEDMHGEAFAYTRQTHGHPAPRLSGQAADDGGIGPLSGDVSVVGGTFRLGADEGEPFVFDNEKWAHDVALRPFAIARAPVTQAEFADFVEAGGYGRRDLWHPEGWAWREQECADCPVYWRRDGGWWRRDFDRWVTLEPHRPMIHVSWYEADAYCRWAGRRLPSEAEWEAAASTSGDGRKWRFPWGDDAPTAARANLDGLALGCRDVAALPAGDSACGCRQMTGNVWEWTADDFRPYPGFVIDPYKEYSAPWFGDHKVLRGGCWATRGRLLRNTWRNFFKPERRDVFAGFRTCAATEGG